MRYSLDMTPASNLREQKKAMTRQAIADITLRLTLEKGLTRVTVEEIAREAFVSPRTVANYFPHKEEAIAAAGGLSTHTIVDQLMDRPRNEKPLTSLNKIMVALVEDLSEESLKIHQQKLVLAEQYPGVKSFIASAYLDLEEDLADAIAHRSNLNPHTDIYPQLAASVAVAVLRLSLEIWGSEHTDLTLAETVQTCFTMVRVSFPKLD